MVSEKFKRQLRQEARLWQQEGLIDHSLYDQLAQRYQFDQLETFAKNRFIMVLIGVGSLLLGLAAITFIAANWDGWTRDIKVAILLGFFITINSVGFYLWKSSKQGLKHRLGLGLLLLGSMILGANISLMSQLFHQTNPIYQLYLLWGIGVVCMAYSLRITILSIVGVILLGIGYFWGFDYIYYNFYSDIEEPLIFQLIFEHFPLLISVILIPLAYWCQSKWLFLLTVLLTTQSYINNLAIQANRGVVFSSILQSFLAISVTCLPPAFLWAYNDYWWTRNRINRFNFDAISRKLSVLFLSILFYIFSFQGIWKDSFYSENINWEWHNSIIFIEPIILFSLTVLAWWYLGFSQNQNHGKQKKLFWRIDLTSSAIGIMIIITALLITYHIAIDPIGWWGVFFFNVLLGLLSFGLIRESLEEAKRLGFWTGIIFIVLQIFTRMLEYDTSLLLKAFVLFLCGIGIIIAGIWFEKYAKTMKASKFN